MKCKQVEWIHLAQNTILGRDVVNPVKSFKFPGPLQTLSQKKNKTSVWSRYFKLFNWWTKLLYVPL